MLLPTEKLKGRLDRLESRIRAILAGSAANPAILRYRGDPVGFAGDILHVQVTPDQDLFLKAILLPPYRVKVRSGHNVGKTFAAALAVVWWHYTRPKSVVITTAPTERDVIDLLWTEVRLLVGRGNLPNHFIGPSAPQMWDGEEHWAKGYTARKGESFQGRHRTDMLFVFDEDEGIDPNYWRTTNTMFQPGHGHAWLSIGNPTTTTSQSYAEESLADLTGEPKWNLFTVSCLNHPNIAAGLAALPLPVPNAVTVEQVDQYVADWATPIDPQDKRPGDFEWRPGSGKWYRPGPLFESRVLGIRPTQATDAVWSEAVFRAAEECEAVWDLAALPELGVDVARFGDDWTVLHGRRGPVSLLHESGNGWAVDQTVGRAIDAAKRMAADFNAGRPSQAAPLKAEQVLIKVDDDGVGGGVTDLLMARGMNVVPVNAGTVPNRADDYRLRRDELWFAVADRAAKGRLSFRRLPAQVRARLRQQALAPRYALDFSGRRVVEPKSETKKRIGRSPDDMDAVNLAFADGHDDVPTLICK